MSKAKQIFAASPELKKHVTQLKNAYVSKQAVSVKIGGLVVSASKVMKEADIEPFIGMVKASIAASGALTENSLKVELTRMRGVLKAIIIDGWKPEEGQGLRPMYNAIPKKGAGGAPKGPRLPGSPHVVEGGEQKIKGMSKEEKQALDKQAAITALFGTCNDELSAAINVAVNNSGLFMSWAKALARAMQAEQAETLAPKQPKAPRQTAKAKLAA